MAESCYLSFRNSVFHFVRFGRGPQTLIAFHGFSEDGRSFLPLAPALGEVYTVYAIDIPYHGKTQWRESRHFTKADLRDLLTLLLAEYNITRFSVFGFSMGGKCAMYATKYFAPQIDALWLLASDGIKTNRIYNVAVYPAWGRELFKTTIRHPRWLFTVVNIAVKLKLITPWLQKFTRNHMATREKRQRLYDTWITMAGFEPDIAKVKATIREHHIRTLLIFGKRDEVIRPDVGEQFAKDLPEAVFIPIERGHYFIDDRLNPVITEALSYILPPNA